jgi:hypothetical protein
VGGRLTDVSGWHLPGECVYAFDVLLLCKEDCMECGGEGGEGWWRRVAVFRRWVGGPNGSFLSRFVAFSCKQYRMIVMFFGGRWGRGGRGGVGPLFFQRTNMSIGIGPSVFLQQSYH